MALHQADKERLGRIADFLHTELEDIKKKFVTKVDYKSYLRNRDLARNIERSVENVVNASLDAAKIILVATELPIPETYREYFLSLHTADLIDKNTGNKLAEGVRLRNVLAHQYLDLKWDRIKRFLNQDIASYEKLLAFINKYIAS